MELRAYHDSMVSEAQEEIPNYERSRCNFLVTQEMLDAGVLEFLGYMPLYEEAQDCVLRIFQAMQDLG